MHSFSDWRTRSFTVCWLTLTQIVCGTSLTTPCHAEPPDSAKQIEFFEKRVRPILVAHCYECHGPDESSGKLRLDLKSGWRRGGESGPAIVPGDPSASLLIQAVTYRDKKLKMPPPGEGKRLTPDQIHDLSAWIRQGAADPRTGATVVRSIEANARTHWAFQPITSPKIESSEHPIDALIDQQLRDHDFIPTLAADNRTLIRRAAYDLTGLPPTTEHRATPPDQFPQLIDRLLASPRYGERWARHWLDVARYSDAKDGVLMYGDARIRPFAYTYRDYVIRAFNDDKPFDQFIREQLAADQLSLPADSPDQAAMGLLTLGRMFDRNRHDIIDDQIDVITRGFLGLTVTCARCHDHKFDPIPTADYYSLYGVFGSSVEPFDRPRIEAVSKAGQAHEQEFNQKLKEVFTVQRTHYQQTQKTARERTADYLVQVATTEPDLSETAIFFLSLLPEQLRPRITYRWRKLIARRAFPEDPIFGPWHDMMEEPKLRANDWRQRGVDPRVIAGLIAANPKTPTEIAQAYGEIIRGVCHREDDVNRAIAQVQAERSTLEGGAINLADIVAGGNGFGTGTKGRGIHPVTGQATTGETGFIEIKQPDQLVAVSGNKFVDGVFVPKSDTAIVSSTGIKISDLVPTSGKTWDYFKFGPSSGATVNSIDGTDYRSDPNWMLAMHANKGITFDLGAMRTAAEFTSARFRTLFGHGGKKGESRLDFRVYLDGKLALSVRNFRAQQPGRPVDIELPAAARFLTLIVTEGGQGISHDQAILGNPRIVPDKDPQPSEKRRQRIAALNQREAELRATLKNLKSLDDDPIASLLLSKQSPVWFPIDDVYYYLSRKQKDAYRGLVNQLDGISVKHKSAAARAMVMVDAPSLYDPVIFQRGDPSQPGNPVPRRFLKIASGPNRRAFPQGSGRLDLANAIASEQNPLTARVWANRVWMHHFGEPLVEDPSDFGLRTVRPLHHNLLDHLASSLIANGWKTKPLHRLIMTSNAYRRASQIPENARIKRQLEADPQNRLLWHANRRRLDLEQMRDSVLAIAGTLDEKMYGRPLLITDPNNKRRTIYSFVERQNLPNIIQTFDFASADTSTARRVTTTVPQQALFAMNSPFMTLAAKALAAKAVAAQAGEGASADRIRQVYKTVLGRPPSKDELRLGTEFIKADAFHRFAQVLLMTNELMFVD